MGKLRFGRTGKRVSGVRGGTFRFAKRFLLRAACYAAEVFGISAFPSGSANYYSSRKHGGRRNVRGLIERCISEIRGQLNFAHTNPEVNRYHGGVSPSFAIEPLEPRQLLTSLDVSIQPPIFLQGAAMSNMLVAGIVGDGDASDYTVTIDWGDELTPQWQNLHPNQSDITTGTITGNMNSGDNFDVYGSHQYSCLGNFNATITLADSTTNDILDVQTTMLTVTKSPLIAVQQFSAGDSDTDLSPQMVAAPDGSVWFINATTGWAGRIAPGTSQNIDWIVGDSSGLGANGYPAANFLQLVVGPDGNVWGGRADGEIDDISSNGNMNIVYQPHGWPVTNLVTRTQGLPTLDFIDDRLNQIEHITADGTLGTPTNLPSSSIPVNLTVSSDSQLWLYDQHTGKMGFVVGSGVTEIALPSGSTASLLTPDHNQNIWFYDGLGNIDKITESGNITQYYTGSVTSIALGADGNIWFDGGGKDGNQLGTINSGGVLAISLPESNVYANGLVLGPDGQLWFSENNDGTGDTSIDEIKLNGTTPVITEYPFPTAYGNINGLVFSGDGNLNLSLKENAIGAIARVVLNKGATFSLQYGQSLSSVPLAWFNDLNLNANATDFSTVKIQWGDGSALSNGSVQTSNNGNYTFQVVGSHNYSAAGNYNTTITVTDSAGDKAIINGVIHVASIPVASISSTSVSTVTVQSPYSLNLSATNLTFDTLTSWTITWGDGSNSTVVGSASTATHNYSTIGSYPVSAHATDAFGNYTATGSLTVSSVPKIDTWNGTTNSNWSLASNWSGGYVPDNLTAVTIPAGKTLVYAPTSSTYLNNSMYSLNVAGNLTISNGTLHVLSNTLANGTLSVQGGTLWGGTSISGNGLQYNSGTLKSIALSGKLAWNSSNVSQLANVSNAGDVLLSNSSIDLSNITLTGGVYEVASNLTASGNISLNGSQINIDSGYSMTWSAANGALNGGVIYNFGTLILGNGSLGEATGSTAPITNYGIMQWQTSNLSLMPYTNNQGNITFSGGGLQTTQPGQYTSNGSAYTLGLSASATPSGFPWTWTVKWGDGAITQVTGNNLNVTLPSNETAAPNIQVSAVINGFPWTAQSSTLSIPAPTNLVAVGGNEAITLNWQDTNTSVAGFEIDQSTDGANFTSIHNTSSGVSNYTISGLSPSTTYFYRVRAFDSSGNFTFASAASATTASTPIAPTGLTATSVSSSQINLAWTNPSGAQTGFVIERSMDSIHFSQIKTVGSGVTSYAVTGLASGTQYSFRVAAFDAGGNSGYTNSASATTSSGAAIVTEGNPYTLSLSTTAPSVDFWTINWGDGSTTAPDIQTIGGNQSNATHTYANSGNYTISPTATHGSTPYASANTTVQVDLNGPTIATAANVVVDSSRMTATLSVLGADSDDESSLIYTWSILGTPPAPVSFSVNGNNDAKNTVATFTATGTYQLLLTIRNADNQTVTKSISVPITQILTSIVATPQSPAPVAVNGPQHFSAVGYDQFGIPFTQSISFNWGVTGTGYSISNAGLLTLNTGYTPGNYSVNVSQAGTAVTSPTLYFSSKIGVQSISNSSLDTATHTSVNLSVTASDPVGSGGLTYTWIAASDSPARVSFSDNGDNSASQTKAVFSKEGTYHLTVMVSDGNANVATSNITVVVGQILTSINVTTTQNAPNAGATQQFSAVSYDQFSNLMGTPPTLAWHVDNAAYSISTAGLLTAGTTIGNFVVNAANGGVTSNTLHFNAGPTITQVAQATSDSSGTLANLQLGATDYAGGKDLTYTWSVISGNANNVFFSDNASNTANRDLAFFSAAGDYKLLCTITSPSGLSLSSSVDVSVTQLLTSIATVAQSGVPNVDGTQQFVGTAYDQFGNPLANQPNLTWTSTNQNDPISGGGLLVAAGSPGEYSVTANRDGISSQPLSFSSIVTIAVPPAQSVYNPRSVNLSVLGGDPHGESTLSYSWSAIGNPPGNVTFSDNFDNTSKNTKATFSAAGAYDLLVTITDQNGYSTTSHIVVTANQTLTSIHITSTQPSPLSGGNQQFVAIGIDQFGNSMATSVTWTPSGSGYSFGSPNGSLHLDSGSTPGAYSVTATNGSIHATRSYTPAVSIADAVNEAFDPTNTFAALTVRGTDASGGSDLTYAWTVSSSNAADVTFSDIYANDPIASFSVAGNYTLQVIIKNPTGDSVTASANISISQVASGISIYTDAPSPAANGTQQFSSVEYDQFGHAMSNQPTISWNVVGTGYSFPTSPGLLKAGSTTGAYTVTASSGTGNATITSNTLSFSPVVTVASAANATLNSSNTSAALSVLGADPGGESGLTYVWTTSGTSPGPVTFSDNATNKAKNANATFSVAGTYDFTVEIIDSNGLETTSHKTVNVTPLLTSIKLASSTGAPHANGTQQFLAKEYDQFGNLMGNPPAITWSLSGTGYTFTSSGATCVITAPATTGNYTVTATSGNVHASVSSSSNLTLKNIANVAIDPSNTFATLTALGADAASGTDLTYNWTLISGNADNYSLEDNNDNTASQAIVDFFAPGTYYFKVTISDPNGHSVVSDKTFTVNDIVSSIVVSTSDPVPLPHGGQTFTAMAYDQFGNVMASQPTFTWTVTGSGYAMNGVVLTAGSTVGAYTVHATANGTTGSMGGDSLAPVIQTPANETPQDDHIRVSLTAAASDMSGTADLTYVWSADKPDDVNFSVNGGNSANTTATLDKAGTYRLTLTVSNDAGYSVSSNVTVTMDQVLTSIDVSSNNSLVATGGMANFTGQGLDQFGDTMTTPTLSWSVTNSVDSNNSISGGVATAGNSPGTYTVTAKDASNSSIQGTAELEIYGVAYTPVLHDVSATVYEYGSYDERFTNTSIDLLSGDTNGDPAGDPYNPYYMNITSQPANGQAYLYGTGYASYVPKPGFTGSDSFTVYTANSDWLGGSITVNVDVVAEDEWDPTPPGDPTPGVGHSVTLDYNMPSVTWAGDGDARVTVELENDVGIYYNPATIDVTFSGSTITISGATGEDYGNYADMYIYANSAWTTPLSVMWTDADPNSWLSVSAPSIGNVETPASVSVAGAVNGIISGNNVYVSAGVGSINGTITSQNYLNVSGQDLSANVTSGGDASISLLGTLSGSVTDSTANLTITADRDISANITASNLTSLHAGRDLTSHGINGTSIAPITVGRDIHSNITFAGNLSMITAGRDMNATLTFGGNIGSVYAGRAISGNITANGSIGNVVAGGYIYENVSVWPDKYTRAGSMSNLTIHAATGVESVSADASLGYDAAMSNVTIIASNGSIGSITAVSGIGVTANASINIGSISTSRGNISGSFTAGSGNISSVTAGNGSLSASLHAGGSIGDLTIYNNITGTITAGGNIGNITASNGNITGNITSSSGNIGDLFAGGDLSGQISTDAGNVGSIAIWGDISKNINANGTLGEVWAFGNISGNISVDTGGTTITSWRSLSGNVQAMGDLVLSVDGDTSGNITSAQGGVDAEVWGTITGNITGQGEVVVWAEGDIRSSLISQEGSLLVYSGGNITGGMLTANWNIWVASVGEIKSPLMTNEAMGTISYEESDGRIPANSGDSSLEETYQKVMESPHSKTSEPTLTFAEFLPPYSYTPPGKKTGAPADPNYDRRMYGQVMAKAQLSKSQGLTEGQEYWTKQGDLWYAQYLLNKGNQKLGTFTVSGASVFAPGDGFSVDYTPDPSMATANIKLVQAIRISGKPSHFDTYYFLSGDARMINSHPVIVGQYPPGYVEDERLAGLTTVGILPGSTTGGYKDAPGAGMLDVAKVSDIEVAAVQTFPSGAEMIVSMIHFQWNAATKKYTPAVQTGLPVPLNKQGVWAESEPAWTTLGGKLILESWPRITLK